MPRFERHGPWELDVIGFAVEHMTFGAYRVSMTAYGPEGVTATFIINSDFELTEPDGRRHLLDAERDPWERLAPLFALRQDTFARVRVTDRSDIRVEFASGHLIAVSGAGRYERWEFDAPEGVKFIGMPGGEPAIWSGEPEHRFTRRDGQWFDGTGQAVDESDIFTGFRFRQDHPDV